MTEETKIKISRAKKGQRASPRTEFKKGGTPWNKGLSKTTDPRMDYERPATFKKGEHRSPTTEFTKGQWRVKTEAHLKAIAAANTGQKRPSIQGPNNPRWKGGITTPNHKIRTSTEMAFWRTHVFKRDDYTCQSCKQRGGKLHADHELPFALFPDLRFEILNGRTLCEPCHRKTPTFGNRGELIHSMK